MPGDSITTSCGPVVLVFGTVNDADIMRHFIEYHLAIGVDHMVGADLGSSDGTLDILSEYERQGCLRLSQYQRADLRLEHRDWLNPLVRGIRERHPRAWMLFADADEFWMFPGGGPHEYLAAAGPLVYFRRCNMVPERSSNAIDFTQFDLVLERPLLFGYQGHLFQDRLGQKLLAADVPPEILRVGGPKIALRADAGGIVTQGFHHAVGLTVDAPTVLERIGCIAHFPVRSLAQWRQKAAMVAQYVATNRPGEDRHHAGHWARLAAVYREGLVDADFDRQILSAAAVHHYLATGVLRRDGTLSARLRAIGAARTEEGAVG